MKVQSKIGEYTFFLALAALAVIIGGGCVVETPGPEDTTMGQTPEATGNNDIAGTNFVTCDENGTSKQCVEGGDCVEHTADDPGACRDILSESARVDDAGDGGVEAPDLTIVRDDTLIKYATDTRLKEDETVVGEVWSASDVSNYYALTSGQEGSVKIVSSDFEESTDVLVAEGEWDPNSVAEYYSYAGADSEYNLLTSYSTEDEGIVYQLEFNNLGDLANTAPQEAFRFPFPVVGMDTDENGDVGAILTTESLNIFDPRTLTINFSFDITGGTDLVMVPAGDCVYINLDLPEGPFLAGFRIDDYSGQFAQLPLPGPGVDIKLSWDANRIFVLTDILPGIVGTNRSMTPASTQFTPVPGNPNSLEVFPVAFFQ